MAGLWRKSEPGASEGKYLVQRRDGTVPEWSWFVIGARDPAAVAALDAYADKAEELGFDPQYVADVREMAADFEREREETGCGDPDAPPHRTDDATVVALMASGRSA